MLHSSYASYCKEKAIKWSQAVANSYGITMVICKIIIATEENRKEIMEKLMEHIQDIETINNITNYQTQNYYQCLLKEELQEYDLEEHDIIETIEPTDIKLNKFKIEIEKNIVESSEFTIFAKNKEEAVLLCEGIADEIEYSSYPKYDVKINGEKIDNGEDIVIGDC